MKANFKIRRLPETKQFLITAKDSFSYKVLDKEMMEIELGGNI